MNLQLQKFQLSSIDDDKVVVFIGKRCTGKSFLCKDLLYFHQNIPVGTVISATEGANQFYGNIIPPLFIHGEYNEHIIANVLKRQKQVVEKFNSEKEQTGGSRIDPRAFLILDDCLYDNSWTKSKHVRSLFMNGSLYRVSKNIVISEDQKNQLIEIIDSLPENFSVTNFKEKSSLTRKYAIPFLEFLDKELVTRKIDSSGLRKKIN